MGTVIGITDKKKIWEDASVFLDHSFPSAYPEFAELGIFPKEKEGTIMGFNPDMMEQWFHGDYIKGRASGEMILEYLRYNYLLEDCIGLPELGGIYQKGPIFFSKYFEGKAIFAWQSVLKMPRGRYVPYLIQFGGPVVFCLHWMGGLCKENFIALRHTESSRIYAKPTQEFFPDNVIALRAKS
jgi:hypothetical protein